MYHILQEEKEISIIMFLLFAVSIVSRVLLGALYNAIIKEADNMASTENKLLKQCKTKFANCYQLSGGVSNISVFVDKFIQRLSFGPFRFERIYHFSGQTMLLAVVFAGLGACKGIVDGRALGEILPFYFLSFFGLYFYFSVSSGVDIKSKKRMLKVNLMDYLENHFSARMDVTMDNIEYLYGDRRPKKTVEVLSIDGGRATAPGPIHVIPDRKETIEAVEAAGNPDAMENPDTQITREELEALLEEFLAVES